MVFGILVPIVVIAAVVFALGWRPGAISNRPYDGSQQTPIEVLKTRYAKGEISREEYEQIRRDLEQPWRGRQVNWTG